MGESCLYRITVQFTASPLLPFPVHPISVALQRRLQFHTKTLAEVVQASRAPQLARQTAQNSRAPHPSPTATYGSGPSSEGSTNRSTARTQRAIRGSQRFSGHRPFGSGLWGHKQQSCLPGAHGKRSHTGILLRLVNLLTQEHPNSEECKEEQPRTQSMQERPM